MSQPARLYKTSLYLTAAFITLAYGQFLWQVRAWGYFDVSRKWLVGMAALGLGVLVVWGIVALLVTRLAVRGQGWFARLEKRVERIGKWGRVGFALLMPVFPILVMGPFAKYLAGFFPRLLLFWLAAVAGSVLLRAALPTRSWAERAALSVLAYGLAFRVALFFPGINSFPFSLSWSEAVQYYYSSLWASRHFYGVPLPLPLFNPTRALLELPPLFLPHPGILISRLWEALLWLVILWLGARTLTRRVQGEKAFWGMLFLLGAWLYLFEAQVYYHLLLAAVGVLWGFDARKPWRTLLVVVLASVWAGLSRINWYPMPAALAICLYLFEVRKQGSTWRYLRWPVVWAVCGMAAAIGSITLYTAFSGRAESHSAISLHTELLWYLLLPNGTYAPGILLAALGFGMPGILLFARWMRANRGQLAPIRQAGLSLALAVFFVGGLVVSVKIGGGNNLHNLDAFWVLLLVVAGYTWFGRAVSDTTAAPAPAWKPPAWLTAAMLLVPVLSLLTAPVPRPALPMQRAAQAIAEIQKQVKLARQADRPVLFINERQLVTFGYITGVEMRPEYESIELMEMIISANFAYTDQLREDLRAQKYGLIISDVEYAQLKGIDQPYGEENNLYTLRAGKHLLCYYEPAAIYEDVGVELFIPRAEDCD